MTSKDINPVEPPTPQTSSVLPFSAERYLHHVEDCEMTQAQKTEFLAALWDIMSTFVRLGFGVESVLPTLFQEASSNAPHGLEQSIPTHDFNVAAGEGPEGHEEEN